MRDIDEADRFIELLTYTLLNKPEYNATSIFCQYFIYLLYLLVTVSRIRQPPGWEMRDFLKYPEKTTLSRSPAPGLGSAQYFTQNIDKY
jgi:hypothetical protein